MRLSPPKAAFLRQMIDHWQKKGVIEEEAAQKLAGSVNAMAGAWLTLVRRVVAVVLLIIAAACGLALAENRWPELFGWVAATPASVKFALLAAVSAGLLRLAALRTGTEVNARVLTESLFALAGILLAGAVHHLALVVQPAPEHHTLGILGLAGVYILLAAWLKSSALWLFGLLAGAAWLWFTAAPAV